MTTDKVKYVDTPHQKSLLRTFFHQRWSALIIEGLLVLVAVFTVAALFNPAPAGDDTVANLEATITAQEHLLETQADTPAVDIDALKAEAFRNLRDKNYEAARAQYDLLIQLQPENSEFFVSRALAAIGLFEFEQAVRDADHALVLTPDFAYAYNVRGIANTYLGNFRTAVHDYGTAYTIFPNRYVLNNLCWVYGELGRYDEAISYCDESIEQASVATEALFTIENRCWVNVQAGNLETALQDCNRVFELDTECNAEYCSLAHWNRGRIYMAYGRQDPALREFDRALEIGSHYANMYRSIGDAYLLAGQVNNATVSYARYVEMAGERADTSVVNWLENPVTPGSDEFVLGTDAFRNGDYAQAVLHFTHVLEADPTHVMAYANRAAAYWWMDEHQLALADYDQIIAMYPESALAHAERSVLLSYMGNYEQAVVDASFAISYDPHLAAGYNSRATAAMYQGQYEEAVVDFSHAIQLDPGDARFFNNRCWALGELGRFSEAWVDCEQSLLFQTELAPRAIVHENRCWLLVEMKSYRGAQQECGMVFLTTPDCTTADVCSLAHWNQGRIYEAFGDMDNALAEYHEALSIGSRYGDMYLDIGDAFYDAGHFDAAISSYSQYQSLAATTVESRASNRIIEIQSSANLDGLRNEAYLQWNNRNFAEAVKAAGVVLSYTPNDTGMLNMRGVAYVRLGEEQTAISDFTRALDVQPDNALLQYNRGATYRRMGEHQKALIDLNYAIDLDPSFALAVVNRGLVYRNMGDEDVALQNFNAALQIDPTIFIQHCDRYRGLTEHDDAITFCDLAVEHAPSNVELTTSLSSRCWLFVEMGQYGRALSDCTEANDLHDYAIPQIHAITHWNRGRVHMAAGNTEEAQRDFDRALRIGVRRS